MSKNNNDIHFVSYCWVLGTTSFRPKQFNYMIEKQLELLENFFALPENKKETWDKNRHLQEKYYDFMKDNNFLKGDATRKDKDAREKTSGLVSMGLITSERRITPAGKKLLEISMSGDFSQKEDNYFGIDRDSYIYLLQLLKVTRNNVRPFVILLKALNDLEYLTNDEFKYLLPLTINETTAKNLVNNIKKIRSEELSIDNYIIDQIWKMKNYQNAFDYFISNEPNSETFEIITINRKSSAKYSKAYVKLYEKLIDVYVQNNDRSIVDLYNAVGNISGKAKTYWRKLLFFRTDKKRIKKDPKKFLKHNIISTLKDEYQIKKYVFEMIHLFKWKSTLDDYFDVNRRYINLSDIIVFQDEKVFFTLLAKEYFKYCIDDFFEVSFEKSDDLQTVVPIEDILGNCVPDINLVYQDIAQHFGKDHIDYDMIQSIVEHERLNEFNRLIDTKFNDKVLLKCLEYFEKRSDNELYKCITDNADAPTMFEYIIGIIWYKLSERKGNILNFMNLSLDSNLLPKTHAAGGEADIVYKYDETESYPEHELLLEATLAIDTTQRRMEMEPVSRHLTRNLEKTKNLNNYATLVSTYIHPSVISDFRSKAKSEYTLDNINFFDGLKLLVLDTQVLKNFIINSFTYKDIYTLLDNAYNSNMTIKEGWYVKEIVEKSQK